MHFVRFISLTSLFSFQLSVIQFRLNISQDPIHAYSGLFIGSYPLKLNMYSPAWGYQIFRSCCDTAVTHVRVAFKWKCKMLQSPSAHSHTPLLHIQKLLTSRFQELGHMENSVLTLSCLSSQVEDGDAEGGQTVERRYRLQLKHLELGKGEVLF